MSKPDRPRRREVWQPAQYDVADIRAIQSLAQYARLAEDAWDEKTMGSPPPAPSPFEVKRALDWIINAAAQTYDNGFAPDDASGRIAAFIDGRQSVGQQIVKLMRLKPDAFDNDKDQ
jgi:hypothetical protein